MIDYIMYLVLFSNDEKRSNSQITFLRNKAHVLNFQNHFVF